MVFDFTTPGTVEVSQVEYIKSVLEFPDEMIGKANTPAASYLFEVNEDSESLDNRKPNTSRPLCSHFVPQIAPTNHLGLNLWLRKPSMNMMEDNTNETEPWYSIMAGKVPMPAADATTTSAQNSLFVGSLSAAENALFLKEENITHILTVAKGLPVSIPEDEDGTDRNHKIVACVDHPMANILEVLPECLEFIHEGLNKYGSVLVHCASGVSRSVPACVAYMLIHCQIPVAKALALVSSTRKYANPNLGFRRQLELLERHQGDIAAAAVTWSRQHSTIVQDTQRQRQVVNELHVRVDALEETIAAKTSRQESLLAEARALTELQTELDACLPTESEGLVDPPAKMIRKSASSKVERLLKSLEK